MNTTRELRSCTLVKARSSLIGCHRTDRRLNTYAYVRAWASAEVVFVATGIGLLAPAVIAAVSLRSPTEAPGDGGVRAQIAGATLLGVIAQANASRTRGQDLNSATSRGLAQGVYGDFGG